MVCKVCGKENSDENKYCIGCGAVLDENNDLQIKDENKPKLKFSGFAISGFVIALVGIIVFAVPCGVASTIFSALAFKDTLSNKARGKGLAIAGLIIGIIDIILGIIIIANGGTLEF